MNAYDNNRTHISLAQILKVFIENSCKHKQALLWAEDSGAIYYSVCGL